jgi:hypothetical protein
LAVYLHLLQAVTVSGALNSLPAAGGDSPISFAPDSGTPHASSTFGRQLQDAQQASARPEPWGGSAGKRPANGRGIQRKDSSDTGSGPYAHVPVAIPPTDPIPFSFSFAPGIGNSEGAVGNGLMPFSGEGLLAGSQDQQSQSKDDAILQAVFEASAAQLGPADLAFAVKATPKDDTPPPPVPETPVPQNASEDRASALTATQQSATGQASTDEGRLLAIQSPAPAAPIRELRRTEGDNRSEISPQPEISPRPAAVPVAEQTSFHPPAAASEARVATIASAESTHAAGEPQVKPSEPLKQLSIQVGEGRQERVELRMVERAGELQVAVRAASPELTQALRQGLSDLVGRLDQRGFHAEAWRPGATASAVQGPAEIRQESTQAQRDSSQGQPGSSQQGRQQGNPNQSHRPQWVEELEGSLVGRGERFIGESNGNRR